MKIGELAKVAKCTTETIRFYEKQGLMPLANRSDSNYRQYDKKHVDRLRFIRNCRALDMTLDEVKSLLALVDKPEANCLSVSYVLGEHIEHVKLRIAELQQLKIALEGILLQCSNSKPSDSCTIINKLTELEIDAMGKRHTHLG